MHWFLHTRISQCTHASVDGVSTCGFVNLFWTCGLWASRFNTIIAPLKMYADSVVRKVGCQEHSTEGQLKRRIKCGCHMYVLGDDRPFNMVSQDCVVLLVHPSPHNKNKQASNKQPTSKSQKQIFRSDSLKILGWLHLMVPSVNPDFPLCPPHSTTRRPQPGGGGGVTPPPKRGQRAKNGPGPRRRVLGPGPRRFVADWGCMARSWGAAAPRCAPSDARLGPFGAWCRNRKMAVSRAGRLNS